MKTVKMIVAQKQQNTAKVDFGKKIARAIELQEQIKTLKTELDEIKELFHKHFELNKTQEKVVTKYGTAILKVSNSYSVAAEKIPELKNIFGDIYNTMVVEKVNYGVSTALKKLLSEADYKYSDIIRNAVIIKTTPSVEFLPINN